MQAISAIGIASVVTIAGVVSKTLKRNLIKDLNDSDFKDFNSYGKCCSSNHNIKDDSYDEVLRHRKGRYYQKWECINKVLAYASTFYFT